MNVATGAERARRIFQNAKQIEAIKSGHPLPPTPVPAHEIPPAESTPADQPKMTLEQLKEILEEVVIRPAVEKGPSTVSVDHQYVGQSHHAGIRHKQTNFTR